MAEDDKTDSLLDDAKKDTGNLETLVEVMRENNASTSNIEADQRNTRRHLLEMKKEQTFLLNHIRDHRFNFEEYAAAMGVVVDQAADVEEDDDGAQKAEDKKEQQNVFEEIRDAIKGQTKDQGKETAKAAGGMMSGMGKMLSGLGIGVGAAGLGMGAMIGAGAYLLKVLDEVDAEGIKATVASLLSINDLMAKDEDSFIGEGGKFFLTMTGIGIGLAAFSAGAGAAAALNYFTKGSDWPETIKENVATLLSISELPGMGWDTAKVVATLGGLGVGLAVFALGKGVAGIAEVGTSAVEKFTEGGNWAQDIKDEVETLLSIGQLGFWDTAGLIATLTGLGFGLAMFAIGKTASGVGDAVTKFQGENFAEDIKKEVATLLSITQLPGIDEGQTGEFVKVMTGLGVGLAMFAVGKAGSGVADALTQFQGDNFAKDIKEEVETLLTIGAESDMGQVDLAMEALSKLGAGLAAFAVGKGLNALADIGAGIVSFFTGSMSPVEQALSLADRAEDIDEGVNAFGRFGDVLERFIGIKGIEGDWALEEMANDLLAASNTLNVAIAGGTVSKGLFRDQDFVGIANIEGMDEALANMALLKSAFTFEVPTTGIDMSAAALEGVEGQTGGTAIITSDNSDSSVITNSQTIITTPQVDKTTMVMQQGGGGPGQ